MHLKSFCLDVGNREDGLKSVPCLESVTEKLALQLANFKIFDQRRKKAPVAEEWLFVQN